MKKMIVFLFLLAAFQAAARENPMASEKAMVTYGNARFTVLTDRLVRMEWAEDVLP